MQDQLDGVGLEGVLSGGGDTTWSDDLGRAAGERNAVPDASRIDDALALAGNVRPAPRAVAESVEIARVEVFEDRHSLLRNGSAQHHLPRGERHFIGGHY